MIVRAIAFTQAGQAWEEKLGFPVERGVPVKKWTQEHFASSDALLYIGACGIAVRAIAPFVKDKLSDPAVGNLIKLIIMRIKMINQTRINGILGLIKRL
ncbi:MAG: hypothetical protein II697_03310 [Clostridia bacterium]|nr:hypothetical protein [Clostridia bacterium]